MDRSGMVNGNEARKGVTVMAALMNSESSSVWWRVETIPRTGGCAHEDH